MNPIKRLLDLKQTYENHPFNFALRYQHTIMTDFNLKKYLDEQLQSSHCGTCKYHHGEHEIHCAVHPFKPENTLECVDYEVSLGDDIPHNISHWTRSPAPVCFPLIPRMADADTCIPPSNIELLGAWRNRRQLCTFQLGDCFCQAPSNKSFDLDGNEVDFANRVCGKTSEHCRRYHGNTSRFGGFLPPMNIDSHVAIENARRFREQIQQSSDRINYILDRGGKISQIQNESMTESIESPDNQASQESAASVPNIDRLVDDFTASMEKLRGNFLEAIHLIQQSDGLRSTPNTNINASVLVDVNSGNDTNTQSLSQSLRPAIQNTAYQVAQNEGARSFQDNEQITEPKEDMAEIAINVNIDTEQIVALVTKWMEEEYDYPGLVADANHWGRLVHGAIASLFLTLALWFLVPTASVDGILVPFLLIFCYLLILAE